MNEKYNYEYPLCWQPIHITLEPVGPENIHWLFYVEYNGSFASGYVTSKCCTVEELMKILPYKECVVGIERKGIVTIL